MATGLLTIPDQVVVTGTARGLGLETAKVPATVASIVADEGYELLDAPVRRLAAGCVPLPFADVLEDEVIPTVDKVVTAVRRLAAY
jgi:pyruvate/2-oxoglutarate/acetoin dehydrogenase E1 component